MIKEKLGNAKKQIKIATIRRSLENKNFTLISQNCIGGVFYHDMKLQFQSPTINLFFNADDFVRFVSNLDYYINNAILSVETGERYPIGFLDDIAIHFMHYRSISEAENAWLRRIERIQWDRIVVCSTDRDGFNKQTFEEWKKIPYPKVLFTSNPVFGSEADSVFFEEYERLGCVPDLIPGREFYKDSVLLRTVNRLGQDNR